MKVEINQMVDIGDLSGDLAGIIANLLMKYVERMSTCAPGFTVPGTFVEELSGDFYGGTRDMSPTSISAAWEARIDLIIRGLLIYKTAKHPDFERIGEKAFYEFGRWATHFTI